MPSSAIVTADIGPEIQVTAKTFTNVTSFTFNASGRVLSIVQGGRTIDFDMSAVTTITCSVSGSNLTFTVS